MQRLWPKSGRLAESEEAGVRLRPILLAAVQYMYYSNGALMYKFQNGTCAWAVCPFSQVGHSVTAEPRASQLDACEHMAPQGGKTASYDLIWVAHTQQQHADWKVPFSFTHQTNHYTAGYKHSRETTDLNPLNAQRQEKAQGISHKAEPTNHLSLTSCTCSGIPCRDFRDWVLPHQTLALDLNSTPQINILNATAYQGERPIWNPAPMQLIGLPPFFLSGFGTVFLGYNHL